MGDEVRVLYKARLSSPPVFSPHVELPESQHRPFPSVNSQMDDGAYGVTGFFRVTGFCEFGGNGEHPEQGRIGEMLLSILFSRSGLKTLNLHAVQTPAWIDTISSQPLGTTALRPERPAQ